MLRFSPILVVMVALALPAQQKGSSAAGASTGSRPVSPPRVPSGQQPTYSGGYPIDTPGSSNNYPFPSEQQVNPMLDRLRRQERQKEVKRDTDRLLALTSQYQAEVKAGGQTPASDRHLKDIEKLARNVRTTLMQ